MILQRQYWRHFDISCLIELPRKFSCFNELVSLYNVEYSIFVFESFTIFIVELDISETFLSGVLAATWCGGDYYPWADTFFSFPQGTKHNMEF